jgi:hypothetical protein
MTKSCTVRKILLRGNTELQTANMRIRIEPLETRKLHAMLISLENPRPICFKVTLSTLFGRCTTYPDLIKAKLIERYITLQTDERTHTICDHNKQ